MHACFALCVFAPLVAGEVKPTDTITTVAGGMSGTIPALSSNLLPMAVTRDTNGNIFVADLGDNIVRRIDPGGNITTVAGNDSLGFTGDGGPAAKAQLDGPTGVALDSAGNLYVADSLNNVVRKVTPAGVISTFAGGGSTGRVSNGDGLPATSASLSDPSRVAVDPGNNVYIADVNHGRIRKVDSSGTITTFAGAGGFSYSGDGGPATAANFAGVGGMAWMPDGSLLIADTYNNRIRRVDANGVINTVAGNGQNPDSGDGGAATAAAVTRPADVAADSAGGFWIAEADGGAVRHVDAHGVITTVDVPGLLRPQGVYSDGSGGVLISDINARLVRLHRPDNSNATVAGNGSSTFSGEKMPAVNASLVYPRDVAFDRFGNIYIADENNYRIRRVSPLGIITTFAGSGEAPCRTLGCVQDNGDGGPATEAIVASPKAVALDAQGNVFFAEHDTSRIRRVDAKGIITTFAGAGTNGLGDNGPAIDAELAAPYGLAFAPDGSLIVADTFNNRVRRIDAAGVITTIAGNGTGGFTGDNGPATAAELKNPTGVAYDSAGNLYIADFSNARVRKVTTNGNISTVAGNGQFDTGGTGLGDGLPATAAALTGPYHVAVDSAGNLYISDQTDNRIRKVDGSGTISTLTGTGKFGYSGDGGAAGSAQDWGPSGFALGPVGGLYFADGQNGRIRAIGAPSPVQLVRVVSTKLHGAAGKFDVDIAGGSTECRSGGSNGEHTVVFTFAKTLAHVEGAAVTSGTGAVSSSTIDPGDAHNYIVRLSGVADNQTVTITLTKVADSDGDMSASASSPLHVLLGDTDASGTVDSADLQTTNEQRGASVTASNFRNDVTVDGAIDCSDVAIVAAASGGTADGCQNSSPTPTPSSTPTPTPTASPNVSPTASPTPTPTVTPTVTPEPTATPSPTISPTPTATPSPAVSPTPAQPKLMNISTRVWVQAGDNAGIAGFIINGTGAKAVGIRAIGPSMNVNGTPVAGRLDDPTLELHDESGAVIDFNDNWKDSPQREQIERSGIAPHDDREAVIARSLPPGTYTAVIRGKSDGTGIGLVEVFDEDSGPGTALANISTRGFVSTGDNVMIGGFIIGTHSATADVVVRAIGPSLEGRGVNNALQDPQLELHDGNGSLFASNDSWKEDARAAEIARDQLAPTDPREAATLQTLPAGNYTAIVRGVNDTTGVALVEAYELN